MDHFVLVHSESQFVWRFETQSPQLLLYHPEIYEDCGINDALVTDVQGDLSGGLAAFGEERMALLAPAYANVLGAYCVVAVLQVQDLSLNCSQDCASSGDGFALVQAARWLHSEYLGSHALHARDPGSAAHEFDCVDRNRAIPGLERGHGGCDVC